MINFGAMIYPKDFEQKIGFDRVRAQAEKLCTTARAREMLAEAGFSSSFAEVARELSLTDEMRTILMMESDFPRDAFVDIIPLLRKIAIIGSFLESADMLILRRGLSAADEVTGFFRRKEEGLYEGLRALTEGVGSFPEIISRIDAIVDRFGKVKDNASQELQTIRRTIAAKEGQVSKKLSQLLREGQASGVIDPEASVSIRDGRAVIPVSAANKRRLKGFIHDESATGKTFYIEPVEVVELNNELKELEYAERREITRILTEFADFIRPYKDEIETCGEYLATMDLIRAKGLFALANECVKPILLDKPHIELHNCRHLLLEQTLRKEGKKVVPLDMKLTSEKHILVISGPNAGGKSVCLKTVGLTQYMLQCGFLIPASENSECGIFESVFMDMGDEQSIDNDLSTYSSHLLNMKNTLRYSNGRSLVLIDEFGSGTEPVMGGAIAEAVLEQLNEKKVFAVITTHYSNLKYYASNHEGVMNGAMSFDVQNIQPLFRLETGKPGSSFAIEIARKIGLPEDIIKSAAEKAGSDHINIERQLREIARDKKYWEGKRDRIRIAEKRADELAEKYEKELSALKEERTKLIRGAKDEAKRVLDDANKNIEATIRTIRESQADKEKTRLARRELDKFREEFSAGDDENSRIEAKMEKLREREQRRAERKAKRGEADSRPQTSKSESKKELAAGDKVRIKGQEAVGEIISISGTKAVVGFGQIMTTTSVSKLESVSNTEFRKAVKESRAASSFSSNYDTSKRRLNFKQQIDVRGERAADALAAVREFVDEAIMLGVSNIKILHGKGTGALKEEIRRYLSTVDVVESYGDEDEKFGGAGITVIQLDL